MDPRQIMELVAGRRVELRERESGVAEVGAPYLSAGEVGVHERGGREARVGEVLAGEVGARHIAADEIDPRQVMDLVAGSRVELLKRESSVAEIGAPYLSAGEVGAGKRGGRKGRIG